MYSPPLISPNQQPLAFHNQISRPLPHTERVVTAYTIAMRTLATVASTAAGACLGFTIHAHFLLLVPQIQVITCLAVQC